MASLFLNCVSISFLILVEFCFNLLILIIISHVGVGIEVMLQMHSFLRYRYGRRLKNVFIHSFSRKRCCTDISLVIFLMHIQWLCFLKNPFSRSQSFLAMGCSCSKISNSVVSTDRDSRRLSKIRDNVDILNSGFVGIDRDNTYEVFCL